MPRQSCALSESTEPVPAAALGCCCGSTGSETFATRVDVLFENVKALKLPTSLDGLVVAEPSLLLQLGSRTRRACSRPRRRRSSFCSLARSMATLSLEYAWSPRMKAGTSSPAACGRGRRTQLTPPVRRRSLALVARASVTLVMVARSSPVSWWRSARRASTWLLALRT